MEPKVNGKVAFAFLNSKGNVKNTKILNYFSMRNNKTPESRKKNYEGDKKIVKEFLKNNEPEVIVLGATSPDIMYIKYRLDQIFEDFQNEGESKPWIFPYDVTIPQIYAKNEKSKKEFKDFEYLLRTAIHFGRYI